MSITWISHVVINQLHAEANRTFPFETGGVLIGYIMDNDVIIRESIGPGPNAIHRKYSFTPDYDYHESEIARVYELSSRKWTYLGDWHSHPRQKEPNLSGKDIQTLRRIAHFRNARIPRPVMLLVAGEPQAWTEKIWQWQPGKFLRKKSQPISLPMRIF